MYVILKQKLILCSGSYINVNSPDHLTVLSPSRGKNAIFLAKEIMHYLLSKFDITRHDGVKCHK